MEPGTEGYQRVEKLMGEMLEPLLASLKYMRRSMPLGEWMILVESRKNELVVRPHHYFGRIDQTSAQLSEMVTGIFFHFMQAETKFI